MYKKKREITEFKNRLSILHFKVLELILAKGNGKLSIKEFRRVASFFHLTKAEAKDLLNELIELGVIEKVGNRFIQIPESFRHLVI